LKPNGKGNGSENEGNDEKAANEANAPCERNGRIRVARQLSRQIKAIAEPFLGRRKWTAKGHLQALPALRYPIPKRAGLAEVERER
jgi:hypothetical protein